MKIDPYYMGSDREAVHKKIISRESEAECLKTSQRELWAKEDKIMWKIVSNIKSIQSQTISMSRE